MRIFMGAVAAVSIITTASAAFADCPTRHFYNNSNVDWTIAMSATAGSCDQPGGNGQTICVAKPGQTLALHYRNGGGDAQRMTIKSSLFQENTYRVLFPDTNCRISHGGSSGNIVLNGPAAGDVTTCGKDYACAAYPGR
jgi:hypothetical protein